MREGGKAFLLFGLGAQHVVVYNGLVHADGVFPVVAASCKLVGILDADLVTLSHELFQHVQVDRAHVDHGLVLSRHHLLHLALCKIPLCASGKSHDHGIVPFVQSLNGDGEEFGCLQGHIVCTVFGRLPILVGIDAEHGKVTRVARPHPVVGFPSELAHARRRRSYHAHIAIYLIIDQVIFISGIERQSLRHDARFPIEVTFGQLFLGQLAQERAGHGFGFGSLSRLDLGVDQVGDVYNAVYEAEFQSRCGQFLFPAHGPEAVGQVVMLHAGVLLDGGVSAMMVGEDQTFGRDDLSRASASEYTDGIFQGDSIRIVDVISFQLQALFFHHVDGILLL